MAETQVWTYQDAVEHVLDAQFDIDRTGRNLRIARKAVLTAYNDLPDLHRWCYLTKRLQVRTEASQSGTLTYTHSGGAYPRVATLASGTWPINAALGRVIINSTIYEIDERKSSTEVTLTVDSNPGSNQTSVSYTWFRSSYTLPVRYRKGYELVEVSTGTFLDYVTQNELLNTMAGDYQPSRPYCYTIHNSADYYGTLEVEFQPPPSAALTYDFMADVSPRSLTTEKYSTGTVTVESGSTTATGTGTTFSSAHVGCIIRFSSDTTNLPTSQVGSPLPDPDGVDNPYFAQRVIMAVGSTTSLTLDAAVSATTTLTGVKYTISDPIDIEAGSMLSLFWRRCELEMARLVRVEPKLLATYQAAADLALIHAAGADHRNKDIGVTLSPRWSSWDSLSDFAIIE